ncbi:MAG: diguanylate cyclase [Spirochaetes bacterium]|nr:diguanylate cyclase [Spirochaetota bacterium]
MAETILLVDDSRVDTALLTKLLEDYTFLSASCGEEMWHVLKRETPSIILLDVVMPGEDGFQIAKKLSSIEKFADIPIIFITSKDTGKDVERGFESGGVDYIKKPFNEIELRARIRSALIKKKQEHELREQTITDPLTGVHNRRYFFEYLDKIVEHGRRNTRKCFSIALIDIDHFKNINDTLGHQAGDFVLRQLADYLKKSVRPYDLVARYGGEEFIILFKDCNKKESFEVLQRIKDSIDREQYTFENAQIHVTFSGGIADNRELDQGAAAAEELVKIADGRMYAAKNAGRNRIVIEPEKAL